MVINIDLRRLAIELLALVGVCVAVGWLLGLTPLGRDDSDAASWGGGRSGMEPMTDALTGCQYLRTRDGGITPRLDGSGRQVGCRLNYEPR